MKDASLNVYIPEENERWLKERCERLDCKVGEYVHELIQKHIDIVSDSKQDPYDSGARLNTLADEVYDETDILLREFWQDTTDKHERRHEPGYLHLMVLWRLLAGEYEDSEREYAMQLAQEYIGEDLDIVPDAPQKAGKWRDDTVGELHPAQFRSRGRGSGTEPSTDDQDSDDSTDETLRAAQFMTADTGGDADE